MLVKERLVLSFVFGGKQSFEASFPGFYQSDFQHHVKPRR